MDPALLKSCVERFFDALGAEYDEAAVRTGYRTTVAVSSNDPEALIGPNGEHLQAINLLMRKLVEQQHGETAANFLVDINNYHEGRMEKVRDAARVLAQRVRLFKRDIDMDPMNSYERLVVHELFANDPEIRTESAGEGKFRHIVLKYAPSSI
jgi:spoIIIJ-associated protein